MQYALVNDIKCEAVKGAKGICEICKEEVIAKCGLIKIYHWAHKSGKYCDNWWEPETIWHRNWKEVFPKEYRELVISNSTEKHRADIYNFKLGVTIEFQNSKLDLGDLIKRDHFYPKLLWVINGFKFLKRFKLTHRLPNVEVRENDSYEFLYKRNFEVYHKCPLPNKPDRVFLGYDFKLETGYVKEHSFYLFDWKNRHKAWFDSNSPVFIDFGDDKLFWLKKREQLRGDLWYVKVIRKDEFIKKYNC